MFHRAGIFIDGSNLFFRLQDHKLRLQQKMIDIVSLYVGGREINRACLYTTQAYLDKALEVHGERFTAGLKISLGDGVPRNGGIAEKGVDALLVADLVYHAAARNMDYALLVSVDTDFAYALKRVEDFGCRTGVLALCSELPERLLKAADDHTVISADEMRRPGPNRPQFAVPID